MRLERDFYKTDAVELAQNLLGKIICRKWNGEEIRARITETEAYMPYDTACHASRGRTKRNAPMYEAGGTSYVYLCYGIHEMFNVVSGGKDNPQAVLIRGVEGANGPGRVTKLLKIDRSLNSIDMVVSNELWIEDDGNNMPKFETKKRIGIDYALEEDRNRLWRFVVV